MKRQNLQKKNAKKIIFINPLFVILKKLKQLY